MSAETHTIADIVDLDRHPIADLESEGGRKTLEACRASMASRGACRLEGFLRPEALDAMVNESKRLFPQAFRHDEQFRVYVSEQMPEGLPAEDPRHAMARSAQACIAWDLFSAGSMLRRLYEWDGLTNFIRAALDKPALFRSADRINACSISFTETGGELGWHFDSAEFSVTLQLQAPEEGGEFQFAPNVRSAKDENYETVSKILSGDPTGVICSKSPPGTLSIFRGHHSLHRVTPVIGETPRITAILTYADQPGFTGKSYSHKVFFGRNEPLAG
ncbi:MAG: hypothetical protein AB7F74_27575 [Parvibaculaceae bacterium]